MLRHALLTLILAAAASAQSPQTYFYVVAHVDVPPPNTAKTITLLKRFAGDTRKQPGLVRIDIQEEDALPNHFAIISVWKDKAAFEAHQGTPTTKQFREELYPLLGAPLDQRPGHLVE
ncbi:MAG TPA: antibiotic biosynthesis monooxygenase family protein [Bryobacteraceae bacterium]|jgi:quinol monooxygenase YgiN